MLLIIRNKDKERVIRYLRYLQPHESIYMENFVKETDDRYMIKLKIRYFNSACKLDGSGYMQCNPVCARNCEKKLFHDSKN